LLSRFYVMDVSFLEDPKTFEYWYEKMKPLRRARIDAIKPEGSRRLSLGAGILLENALSELGITEYGLETGDCGKPYLINKNGEPYIMKTDGISHNANTDGAPHNADTEGTAVHVFFNLSHSGTKVALGISDKEIGVDIEKVRGFKDSLINRIFSDDEKELAKMLSESDGQDANPDGAYTALWTAKESVMKYSAKGLSLMPETIELAIDGSFPGKRNSCEKTGLGHEDKGLGDLPMKVACLKASAEEPDCSGLTLTVFAVEGYRLCVCSEYKEFDYHEE